ncbi:MAG: hypothetical protein Q8O84_00300 [Nanoarchaeota archaeon]|nr:hypothetical protein [Nanoarchaeota archaeon]
MKNKKGMLLAEETLKMVIAIIVIVFLVYFLTNLYFGKLKDDAMKSSEQLLISSDQSIKNIIESLEEGESKSMTPQEINWNLFSFTGQEKPNSCAGKNCLCICDEVLWENSENVRQVNECNKNGVCTIVSNLKNEKVNIELQKDFATEILISKQNNEVSIK